MTDKLRIDIVTGGTHGLVRDAEVLAAALSPRWLASTHIARLRNPPPPDLPGPAWQLSAAHAVHATLYLLFFAVPLVGWAYSSAAGLPIALFGLIPLPDFVPADKALAQAIKPWHGYLAFALAALVLLHVAAALKHHWMGRDGLLSRMWPARS